MANENNQELVKEAAAQIEQNFEKTVLDNKIQTMNDELALFAKTQVPDHFRAAIQLRNELEQQDHKQPDLAVNTKALFEKGFKFDGVSQYDNVVNQLTEVLNAQENLNNNPNNDVLLT